MTSIRHIHTLRKIRAKKGVATTFQCNNPDCTWKSPANLIEGKRFLCNFCNEEYLFTAAMKRMKFPHCKACTSGKKKTASELSDDIMKDLGLEELNAPTD
jgi:hypothetical protein